MNSIWNEKACFARAGRKCRHGYKITFKDCQRFQRLREKTQRTLIVLDSCAAVVKGCCALCQILDVLDGENGGRIALWNIGSYSLQIQCYRSKVYFLLGRCSFAADLVRLFLNIPVTTLARSVSASQTSKIIAFRDDELAQGNHEAMRESFEVLKHIILQERGEL